MKHPLLLTLLLLLGGCQQTDPVGFSVGVDEQVCKQPVNGRVLVALAAESSRIPADTSTLEAPFWDDEQPFFGASAHGLHPGRVITLDDSADALNTPIADLKPGRYRASARMIVNHATSSWRHDEGNLYSDETTFTVEPGTPVQVFLTLNHAIEPRAWPAASASPGVELFELRSKLLSTFLGRDVIMRAGVVLPAHYDPKKSYAAIYLVPGFGGDHFDALHMTRASDPVAHDPSTPSEAEQALARETFIFVLDPESPNGHTLFADSANNGPRGEALVRELIPALEAKYPLIGSPAARMLRGHSSGGWSTLWLALQYPETFGATWSSSPDPIDFRAFETVNIYEEPNMFAHTSGPSAVASSTTAARTEFASFRRDGKEVMTIRQEAGGERVLGPDQTSGQQWHSWMAVFGPRARNSLLAGFHTPHPAALFDPVSGDIDRTVAELYRRYDIGHLLRTKPERYAPIWRERIRLVVGGEDSFYLERAVQLVAADLKTIPTLAAAMSSGNPSDRHGYTRIVPECDHSTIFQSAEVRAFPAEMFEHLKRSGCLSKPRN